MERKAAGMGGVEWWRMGEEEEEEEGRRCSGGLAVSSHQEANVEQEHNQWAGLHNVDVEM
ncbi:hypothetical protein EYF80_057081 [Liparis tanakae]|uniref:Uncharacterized protein n=1 Tax=Liparis tanakae TaxID=230148 RepID=A0A4Z2EV38_9TELE|nr:hypothetical protein EYF80_057081 [Liparis tanakae]